MAKLFCKKLAFKKTTKDSWQIFSEGSNTIIVRYEYYCAQADAGACWIDEEQVYINPIHCFLYITERLHEPCTVELNLPSNYKVACSLEKKKEHLLSANDFHQLFDSPFIASTRSNEFSFFVLYLTCRMT